MAILYGMVNINTKDNLRMVNQMEKVFLSLKAKFMQVHGLKEHS